MGEELYELPWRNGREKAMIKKASLPWHTLQALPACAMLLTTVAHSASSQTVDEALATASQLEVQLFHSRAMQGDAAAQFVLGLTYQYDEGLQDYAEAARWYRRAAEQGLAQAQNQLGAMYALGQGVPQDDAEAVRLYRSAAEQGLASAQSNLGVMYASGLGVLQDYVEAVRWYRLAAQQGDTKAQRYLGGMYSLGRGVPQDFAEAARWFKHAAEWGDVGAQTLLALAYIKGEGIPQDYVEAHKWSNIAAARSSASQSDIRDQALHVREMVAAGMTPAQIAEAQRLAREWQPASNDR